MPSRISTILTAALLVSTAAAQADVEINSKPTSNMSCDAGVCTATAQKAVLNVTDLANMLASGDVAVKTGLVAKDIEVSQPLTWSSTSRLTLDAQQSVTVKKQITVAGQGALTVTTSDTGQPHAKTKTGEFIIVPERVSVQFWDLSSSLIIDGNSYTLVGDIKTLASDIAANPSGFYALAKPYDASVDGTYTTSPVQTTFNGIFEGLGNAISNLKIEFPGGDDVGLFRSLGSGSHVSELRIVRATIQGTTSHGLYGGTGLLAGDNYGIINRVSANGSISIPIGDDGLPGGVVGANFGTISEARSGAAIHIFGPGFVGGLAGLNEGVVTESGSEGSLSSALSSNGPGGLIGSNSGSIAESYSFAKVGQRGKCCGGSYFGELVGENDEPGHIADSYAAGEVRFSQRDHGIAGGVVGFDTTKAGDISHAYWDLDTGVTDPGAGAGNIENDPGTTGLTTRQLQSQLPRGFSPKIWGLNPHINHGYPYLLSSKRR